MFRVFRWIVDGSTVYDWEASAQMVVKPIWKVTVGAVAVDADWIFYQTNWQMTNWVVTGRWHRANCLCCRSQVAMDQQPTPTPSVAKENNINNTKSQEAIGIGGELVYCPTIGFYCDWGSGLVIRWTNGAMMTPWIIALDIGPFYGRRNSYYCDFSSHFAWLLPPSSVSSSLSSVDLPLHLLHHLLNNMKLLLILMQRWQEAVGDRHRGFIKLALTNCNKQLIFQKKSQVKSKCGK